MARLLPLCRPLMMAKKNSLVDAYIREAAPFARPILKHLRKVVHAGCPGVEETIKWRFPHFVYQGNLAWMAGFKQHCAFGFWKGSLLLGAKQVERGETMGHFGRITRLSDLPNEKELFALVRKAVELNEAGIKRARPARGALRPLDPPDDFAAALRKNSRACRTFEGFPPGKRNDYVRWVSEAKRPATRQRRLVTSIAWLAEGKAQNWKYDC